MLLARLRRFELAGNAYNGEEWLEFSGENSLTGSAELWFILAMGDTRMISRKTTLLEEGCSSKNFLSTRIDGTASLPRR